MKIKKYLDDIIEKGTKEDMIKLEHVFYKAMEHIEKCDEELYYKLCDKLYVICYGRILTEDRAKDIVKNMKPYGMHWSLEETKQVQVQNGLTNLRDIDFFVVMNSAYNDYKNIFGEDLDIYIKYAKEFIEDEDGRDDKVFLYFTTIPIKE